MAKRAKIKKVYSRRARTGIAAAPTNNFNHFNDYLRLEVDKKELSQVIKDYIRKNLKKADAQVALKAPEWAFTALPYLSATISWKNLGNPFPSHWKGEEVIKKRIAEILEKGRKKAEVKEEEPSDIPKRTIADIVKERTSDFIAGIEEKIDAFPEVTGLSVYDELKKIDAPNNTAKGVYEFYLPQLKEMQELITKKPEDLVEAYRHMTAREKKAYMKFLEDIVTDAERYMASKKAQRKTRTPKVKTADKQVARLTYLKESKEHKLVSINPTNVVGANRIYLFNVKSRLITELVCRLAQGFEVNGTTIKGIDEDISRNIRLRKPEEFLPLALKKTPNQINKEWGKLTTKSGKANGRINKDTIILRALDR